MANAVVIIDAQNDFCTPGGALYVPHAEDDCGRLARWIMQNQCGIDCIHMTLDTHPYYHIAHPVFWKDAEGNHPAPYTIITYSDYAAGTYVPVDASLSQYAGEYLMSLEARGRYQLTIWPPHCLVATPGYCIEERVWQAVHEWEKASAGKTIDFVIKALNFRTEHYSAIQAEVPDPHDTQTRTNFAFIENIKDADTIVFAGEALSHCVANTLQDLSQHIPYSKMVLLTDCASNVAGFEQTGEAFLEQARSKGLTAVSSAEFRL
ncbi:MAG TPA: hypothetical protein IAA30_07385 [Candidatus Treponema faecavium]|nr:hypothetical protein [Candidatus Treponema faecavium]